MFKKFSQPYKSVLIIKCNGVSDLRMDYASRALAAAGYDVTMISETPYYMVSIHDIFLASRPGEEMCKLLNVAVAVGKRVIADFDDDFLSITPSNPAFPIVGAGHPTYHITLKRAMKTYQLTYANQELLKRYKLPGTIIPNVWDEENPLWTASKHISDKIRIGFTGSNTHQEDFRIIIPALKSILAARPNVKIVIGNDFTLYEQFAEVPEPQKFYLPPMTYKDYPSTYRYVDILLCPLVDNHFNRAKSDIKLVEAGATRTPWIASALPAYKEWADGGILVESTNDWEAAILDLIDHPEKRSYLAKDGNIKAQTRRSGMLNEIWKEVVV